MKQLFFLFVPLFLFSCSSGDNEKKEHHTVVSTKTINNNSYELQYPSNWLIDTTDKDYDPESYFTIDAPVEDGVSMFLLFNVPIDEKEHVDKQVKAQLEKVIKNGEVSYLDNWGKFKGHGAIIKGKVMGVWQGEVKIFCHSGDSCSFLAVQQYLYADKEIVLPGFKLIESSFTLKK